MLHLPSKQKDFIERLMASNEQVFFFESFDLTEKEMIDDIYEYHDPKALSNLFLRSRVITLIHEFFQKAAERQSLLAPAHNNHYEEMVHQVAARLTDSIRAKMPSVKDICAEFAVSESTLQRNFRKVLGKSIHDYYVFRKMEYAKNLISEGEHTVTQIAYMLGYEKAGTFIAMFKKQTGSLPGSMRKKIS